MKPHPICAPCAPKSAVDSLAAPVSAAQGVQPHSLQAPLAGIFRVPCGMWVRPERFASGATWFRPIPVSASRFLQIARQRAE